MSYNLGMSDIDPRILRHRMKESEALLEREDSGRRLKPLWLDRLSVHEEILSRGDIRRSDTRRYDISQGDSGKSKADQKDVTSSTSIGEVHYGFSHSPFGPCRIEVGPKGILALDFLDPLGNPDPATSSALSRSRWPNAACVEDAPLVERLVADIFSRDSRATIAIHIRGSAFQVKIWRSLLRIPESSIVSYTFLAQMASCPGASRAAGSALATNPIAYLIPCHRVLRADGRLGGFKWGLERKAVMIAYEAALHDTAFTTAEAF